MITHVVLFKLKDPSRDNVLATVELLRSMNGRVDGLAGLEVGRNQVESPRHYDVALITRFKSWEDLDAYRTDTYHVETILAHMSTVAESSVVVDYVEDDQ